MRGAAAKIAGQAAYGFGDCKVIGSLPRLAGNLRAMVSRKYLKDYRIDEHIDITGRVRSEAVYIGGDYTLSPRVSAGDKRLFLLLSVLAGSFYFVAMVPVTRAARLAYVILPLALTALPISLMAWAAASLLGAKEVVSHEKAERISTRLPLSALVAAILSGASFLGLSITAASWDSALAGDYIFGACSLAISMATAAVFRRSKNLKPTQLLHALRDDNTNNNKIENKKEE